MNELRETGWDTSGAHRVEPVQRTVGFPITVDSPSDCAPPRPSPSSWTARAGLPSPWRRRAMTVVIGLTAACLVAAARSEPAESPTAWGLLEGRVVSVPARIGGFVTAIQAKPGDTVKRGQVLATIDETQLASGRNLPGASGFREVRATASGRLVSMAAAIGEFVAESEAVAEILRDDTIVAKLYLSEPESERISAGGEIQLQSATGAQLGSFIVERRGDLLVPRPDRLPDSGGANDLVVELVARPVAPATLHNLRVGSVVGLVAPGISAEATFGRT